MTACPQSVQAEPGSGSPARGESAYSSDTAGPDPPAVRAPAPHGAGPGFEAAATPVPDLQPKTVAGEFENRVRLVLPGSDPARTRRPAHQADHVPAEIRAGQRQIHLGGHVVVA